MVAGEAGVDVRKLRFKRINWKDNELKAGHHGSRTRGPKSGFGRELKQERGSLRDLSKRETRGLGDGLDIGV